MRDSRLPHELARELGVDDRRLIQIVDDEIKNSDRTRRPEQIPLRRIHGSLVLAPKEVERIKELFSNSRARVGPDPTWHDRRSAASTGAASDDRLPLGVMSLAELERYDDPVVQIPFLSSLLEYVLRLIFPNIKSEKRGLIKEAYHGRRVAIRSVNERELNYAMTIRNRIVHPISDYDDPAPSPQECRIARDNLLNAVREAIDHLPDSVNRKMFTL